MNSVTIFIVLALIAVVFAQLEKDYLKLFKDFKAKYGRKYKDSKDEATRLELFRLNLAKADNLNKLNGRVSFGVSKFSDRTDEEYSVLLGRKNKGATPAKKVEKRSPYSGGEKYNLKNVIYAAASKATTASLVDWTAEGVVTPVKNQGQCGSCWAHSAAEQIESQWVMQGNSIWEFSVQQIASCTSSCLGCGGGDTPAAYEYIMSLSTGLGSNAFAPYVQSMYNTCLGRRCTEDCTSLDVDALATEGFYTGPYATVSSYEAATDFCTGPCKTQNMTELAANVAVYGPASICVNAANWGSYTGGVMTADACGGSAYSDLDHCVQLVGFNSEASEPYWIVRNSWATNWERMATYILPTREIHVVLPMRQPS